MKKQSPTNHIIFFFDFLVHGQHLFGCDTNQISILKILRLSAVPKKIGAVIFKHNGIKICTDPRTFFNKFISFAEIHYSNQWMIGFTFDKPVEVRNVV